MYILPIFPNFFVFEGASKEAYDCFEKAVVEGKGYAHYFILRD